MSQQDTPTAAYPATIWTVALGVLIVLTGVGAFLALVLTGHEENTTELLAFLAPSAGALIIVGYQRRQHAVQEERLTQQDEKLAQIVRQTNGVLDQRIRDNTRAALSEMLQEHLR